MHYLRTIMLQRHLLAFFALLSGLAVLQAPAQAATAQSVMQDARAVASTSDCPSSEASQPARAREQSSTRPRRQAKKTWTWLPSWLRPTVIFGSERALE